MLPSVRRVKLPLAEGISLTRAVIAPEQAPASGACALCARPLDRASFCCGCGAFVCWNHGEPPPDPKTHTNTQQCAWTPHAPTDHGAIKLARRVAWRA